MTHALHIAATDLPGGIVEGTMIMTLKGAIPVDYLRPGDRIITRAGACTLRGMTKRKLDHARIVEVSPGALGHGRPDQPLRLFADQPVVVRDWRAKALYGADCAVVPAARLADGDFIRRTEADHINLFTLEFDRAEIVLADGVELACAPALVEA
jgi:hypothetical protein